MSRAGLIVLIAALSGCGEATVESSDAIDRHVSAAEETQQPAEGARPAPDVAPAATKTDNKVEPPPSRDARAGTAGASEFDVVLALNGGASELFRGAPVIAEIAVFALHDGSLHPLTAKGGDWSSVVRWEVQNEQGERQDWKLQLVPPAQATLTATRVAPIQFRAWLPPEETKQLAAGAYRVVAVIDATPAQGSAKPLRSEQVSVELQDEPRDMTPAQQSRQQQVWATYWSLRGDPQQALKQIDEHLKAQPGDVAVFALKAELLAQTGDVESALEACRHGIDAHLRKHGKKGPPPAALLIRQRELLDAAIAQDAPGPAVTQAAASPPAPAAAKPLSEKDLIALLRLEIGDDAIVAKIGKDGVLMNLDEAIRKRLRDAGAGEKVLAAIEKAAENSAREKPLTVENIVSLLRLDISSDVILERLKKSTGKPTLTSEQRDELKKAGAWDKLLNYLSGKE